MRKPTARSRVLPYAMLGISLLFVVAGIGMIVTGADGGISTAAFFGVCAAVAVWQLWPDLLEPQNRSVDTLLAEYPGPIVLRASTRKLLFLAVLSSVFGGVILWMLLDDAPSLVMQLLLWPGVVLFLGGAPLMVLLAILGSSLHLDATGLAIQQIRRSRPMLWHELSGFTVATVARSQRMVVFDDAGAGETRLVALNRSLTGRGGGLPDSYGLDPDDLAALLSAWRARAVGDETQRG